MRYQDFSIRILSKRDNGYDVIVDSPQGSSSAYITLPDELAEALTQLQRMGGTVRSAATREAVYESEQGPSPAELGAKLFEALFADKVGKMFYRSSGALEDDPDVGLRIKLLLNLEDPDVSALAQIPWEFVYEADRQDFLALRSKTPFVRYVEVPRSPNVHRLEGALRILVVISNPQGMAALNLDKERKLIESTWADESNVEVDFLEHPTKEKLLQHLVEKRYHVLHFMGHGAYDKKTGAGALVLEDEAGNPVMLDAQTFGTWLSDAPRLKLIFLNACDTGRTDEDTPFAGVANRLVLAGLPAVVAMQLPISDDAAIAFARTFYSRLAAGFPVDEATAQGRKAITTGKSGTIEWATPVLFMRAPDGLLFEPPDATGRPSSRRETRTSQGKLGYVAAAAVVVAAAAGGIIWWQLQPDESWSYEDNSLEVYVGDSVNLRLVPAEENPSPDDFNSIQLVTEDGEARISLGEAGIFDNALQARVEGLDVGEVTVRAISTDAEPGTPAYIATIDVSVDPVVQAAYDAAIANVKDASVPTAAAIRALEAISPTRSSSAMRAEVERLTGALGAVEEARRVAEGAFAVGTLGQPPADQLRLADKIALYDEWMRRLQSIRSIGAREVASPAAEIRDAVAHYNELSQRTAITEFEICRTRAEWQSACQGRLTPYDSSRVYVHIRFADLESDETVTVHAFDGDEMAFSREYTVTSTPYSAWIGAGNLPRSDLEVRLYNAEGEWIATKTLN